MFSNRLILAIFFVITFAAASNNLNISEKDAESNNAINDGRHIKYKQEHYILAHPPSVSSVLMKALDNLTSKVPFQTIYGESKEYLGTVAHKRPGEAIVYMPDGRCVLRAVTKGIVYYILCIPENFV